MTRFAKLETHRDKLCALLFEDSTQIGYIEGVNVQQVLNLVAKFLGKGVVNEQEED